VVGFAAETDDPVANAAAKLRKKHLDLIVANEVGTAQSGFGSDTVRAWFLSPQGAPEELPLLSKEALAEKLLERIAALVEDARG